MLRPHLTLLTMLVVATVGSLAHAQTKTPTAADSAAADSLKPKKSGRFGGLMNKAKSVAGNKTVQHAAKIAGSDMVKGAAMGVACTVVPGAAVVSAATGQGPCANAGLVGMLTGGNGMGMMSGLSNAAASGAAMKLMKNSGSYGMSNIAAAAASARLMQTNGMSNAAAMAAMKNAGLSSMDMAAAMKMLEANGPDMMAAMQKMQKSQARLAQSIQQDLGADIDALEAAVKKAK